MHALIFMSDTGGGHRALSRAIAAAVEREDPRSRVSIVDAFASTKGSPVRWFPQLYGPAIRRARKAYGWMFAATDDTRNFDFLYRRLGGPLKARMREILVTERPDVVVFAHSLAVRAGLDVIDELASARVPRLPSATMAADLVTLHASWIDDRADRIFVATEEVERRFVRVGVDRARLLVTGLPVGPRFGHVDEPPDAVRARLRLAPRAPIALLLAGGEGSGPVVETVTRLTEALPELHLVVVCGRNPRLQKQLDDYCLPPTVQVLGFVDYIADLMHAVDFVITKGGPQSISETLASGKPMIVTDLLPGQEQGNGAYVVRHGAGYLGLTLPDVLAAARRLTWDADARARLAGAARAAGRPEAGATVARELLQMSARSAA